MDTTTRSALRGVKRLRWWRRHGFNVTIAIMSLLIVCAMWNIIKVAANANREKYDVTLPVRNIKVKEETTTITLETVTVLPIEANSNNQKIQQYTEEEFVITPINYYSAGETREEVGYCTNAVEHSEVHQREQVYTYLGRTYNENDVHDIARIAWFEQGICGKEMTQLAAAVLINRSHWSEFGATYIECFYQDGQYAIETIQRFESSEEIPEEAYDWIRELLSGESAYGEVPTTVVFQAQFPQGIDTYATAANTYICYADEARLGEYIP